jgi:hypothetical protein
MTAQSQWAIDEIKEIQSTGIDWFGAPLKVDGVRGPKTDFWIGILSLDKQRQDVIKLALKYHHEGKGEIHGNDTPNDGSFVDMLLKARNMRNQPWCLAFCSHVLTSCGVTWPEYHVSAWGAIEWAKKHGRAVATPLPGDLEVYTYDKKPGEKNIQGHGRIVLAYDAITKETVGVDGNVSDRVTVGRRNDRPRRTFIRPASFSDTHGKLVYPNNCMRLDNLGDR